MSLRVVQFLAILLTALALIPFGAHLFELPNKVDLPRDAYLTVQGIYAGWAWFGLIDPAALVLNVLLAVRLRRQRAAFHATVVAALCLVAFLAIFFIWTFPANWTTLPDDWSGLRRIWETSHAVNAVVMLIAFCSVTLSVITARED